jgi:hypothetical protein
MRGLFGDFATMPLKDLVVYLGNKRATGTLSMEREAVRKHAIVVDGFVVSAGSNDPREFLGQFLINMGHITEDQFAKAYQTQKETKVFLGKILTMIGLVNEQIVVNALAMKVRETMLGAFLWTEGTFSFETGVQTDHRPEGLEVKIDLLDIHRESEFRETAWKAIRGAFPSGEMHLQLDESKLPEPPKPGSIDERIVGFIKAGQTIDEMALGLHASDFYLYQRLYAFYRLEAVKPLESFELPAEDELLSGSMVMGEDTPTEEILMHARRFLEEGNFSGAETLARQAHELQTTVESTEVLREAETALLNHLRKQFSEGNRIAHLLVATPTLKDLQLTAQEKYLLSRIDGSRDVASIIAVSPLRELEALKLFSRFLDKNLVRLV